MRKGNPSKPRTIEPDPSASARSQNRIMPSASAVINGAAIRVGLVLAACCFAQAVIAQEAANPFNNGPSLWNSHAHGSGQGYWQHVHYGGTDRARSTRNGTRRKMGHPTRENLPQSPKTGGICKS